MGGRVESSLVSLQTLEVYGCKSLSALPDLSALSSLQTLDARHCKSLAALPDMSSLASLQTPKQRRWRRRCTRKRWYGKKLSGRQPNK